MLLLIVNRLVLYYCVYIYTYIGIHAAASTFQKGWCHPVAVVLQNCMLKPDFLDLSASFYLHHYFVISYNRGRWWCWWWWSLVTGKYIIIKMRNLKFKFSLPLQTRTSYTYLHLLCILDTRLYLCLLETHEILAIIYVVL